MPLQNLKIRRTDLCPICQEHKIISHEDMVKQDIDVIQAGLVQHNCWLHDQHWYTRLSQEQKAHALEILEKA